MAIAPAASINGIQRDPCPFAAGGTSLPASWPHASRCGARQKHDKLGEGVDLARHPQLAAVDLARLGDAVRWEPARGGQLFPHIYGVLPIDAVISFAPVERTPDGAIKLPA